jgi:hypothetical protein
MDVKRYEATVDAEYAAVQAERAALLQREVGKGLVVSGGRGGDLLLPTRRGWVEAD